jgi:hypothetical protein
MNLPEFRVWHQMKEGFDPKTKEWSYAWRMSSVQIINVTAGEVTIESKYGFGNRLYKVGEACIMMQSIGITDIHGKPVFLGDIVKVKDSRTQELVIGVVEEKQAMRVIKTGNDELREWENYEVEIIGNKYEHPQMVNG